MATNTTIVNRALQVIGTRTTVTDAELVDESTNEAIQANLILAQYRDDLLRLAPWDCAFNYTNLRYITSIPGTPENMTAATQFWEKGQPPPPWAYEFQYPVDCLRACWIIPANQIGTNTGIPITTAITGGPASLWMGPPVKFKVVLDQFLPVTAAVVASGGTDFAVGDIVWCQSGSVNGSVPIGAGVALLVTGVSGGVITTVTVIDQLNGADTRMGGSYFAAVANPQPQATQSTLSPSIATTGNGTGATFNLTFGSARVDQRVIVCNQEFPTLAYVRQITDPNVMDPLFQQAWVHVLAAGLAMSLTGDKVLANGAIEKANMAIAQARSIDGNEGPTVNDVTPDWIRVRGVDWNMYTMGGSFPGGFDWGSTWPMY